MLISETNAKEKTERSSMNLAKNYISEFYNPIDTVENIFGAQNYQFDRRSNNEVAIEIQGKWNNMLLFFAWEENMRCLHLSCLMDIESTIEDRSKIFELLALVNEELWVGHFSYWTEQKMPVFKHSLMVTDTETEFAGKISQLTDIAVKECERMYPIFNVVLTKGMEPRQALYPLEFETIGRA